MSDIDEEAPEYDQLMATLHKVHIRDTDKHLKKVQDLLVDDAVAVNLAASKTYLKKEVIAGCSSSKVSMKDCDKAIRNLQTCVNNTAAVQAALSNIVIQAQLQDAMEQHVFKSSSLSPEAMSVVSSSRECEELQVQLGQVLASIAHRQQVILEKRVQLAALHKRVTALWQRKQHRDLTVTLQSDEDDLKALRERLRGREGRVEIISHFLQTLIMGASVQWGKNLELVQRYLCTPAGAAGMRDGGQPANSHAGSVSYHCEPSAVMIVAGCVWSTSWNCLSDSGTFTALTKLLLLAVDTTLGSDTKSYWQLKSLCRTVGHVLVMKQTQYLLEPASPVTCLVLYCSIFAPVTPCSIYQHSSPVGLITMPCILSKHWFLTWVPDTPWGTKRRSR
ncbi:hypothetical protein FHG87_004823 [Trinorchestia longiramus]|nr:hypothetical protein FHG87_004823 [Trinorchestia longiramus]